MLFDAVLIYELYVGEPIRRPVPWSYCLEEVRQFRYLDAVLGPYAVGKLIDGMQQTVRDVRCEDRNATKEGAPTS